MCVHACVCAWVRVVCVGVGVGVCVVFVFASKFELKWMRCYKEIFTFTSKIDLNLLEGPGLGNST